jgi:NADPH:quinone reductase-like Zn-dependent oxidoreductase
MRAAGVRALGAPLEALVLPEPPAPSADEVLINVQAAGVGNWDDLVRTGGWDVGTRPPMALGVEAAGIVRVLGTHVTRFVPGDSVLVHSAPLRYQGAWAEQFLADAADVARMPTALAWAVAGALPVPLLTALQVVGATACGPNDTVLVHGAGGVTGGLIVAMAAPTGASIIATSSAEGTQRVRSYGAGQAIDYHDPAWRAVAKRASSRGFSVVLNAVRGAAAWLLDLVADGGRLATITGDPPASERGITITDLYVAPDGRALEAAAATLAARGLSIAIAGTYSLTEAATALEHVTRGGSGGAGVVLPARTNGPSGSRERGG